MSAPNYVTLGLTFGAYAGGQERRAMLTHTVRLDEDCWVPLCGKVQPDSLGMNETPEEDAAPPTCKTCLCRDPRFRAATPPQRGAV